MSDLQEQIRELEDRLDLAHSEEIEKAAKDVALLQD